MLGAKLDRAISHGVRLYETQHAVWSIKGIQCEQAYWDSMGVEATKYAPGEFEKLHSEQPSVQLFYKGGLSQFELNTLPALLKHLASLHPDARVRLKSVQETGGGAIVSITVEDADQDTLENVRAEAARMEALYVEVRSDLELVGHLP
jgi:hypothetical protein